MWHTHPNWIPLLHILKIEREKKITWTRKPVINIPSQRRGRICVIIDHIAITIHSNYSRVKASIPEICQIVNNITKKSIRNQNWNFQNLPNWNLPKMAELLPQDTDKDLRLAGSLNFGINNRKHLIQIPSPLSLKQQATIQNCWVRTQNLL